MNVLSEANLKSEFMFFTKFIKNPRTVGSIYPSSKYLAKKMLRNIKWQEINSIVELGAGTGVFTQHIDKLKKDNCDALIFELDNDMRNNLEAKYNNFKFFKDVRYLSRIISENNLKGADCIVSGLPFAVFSKEDREYIINEVVNSLNENGMFVAFQYSLQMKETLKKNFSRVDISFEPRNIPPAFVYTCYK